MRAFLVIWSGQACSLLGSQLVQFALVWWLTRTTGSATMLALASLVALLPQIALSPFAGALVDRWSRRRVMIAADAAIALATVTLIALFVTGAIQTWHVYVVLFARAAGAAFHWPAMQASTTLMVPREHLPRVGGMNQALAGVAGIAVPPLGALAIEAWPMPAVLAIDVVTAALAITPLLFIAVPQPPRQDAAGLSVFADMRAALRFLTGWRALLLFSTLGTLVYLLGGACAALLPVLVFKHFGGGALQLGWLQSAGGLGAIAGGLALSVWSVSRRRILVALLALALDGVAIAVVGLTPAGVFGLALAALFASGFLEAITLGLNGAVFQVLIPPEMQGRVFGVLVSAAHALAPLGLIIAGPFADAFGAGAWWVLAGVGITIISIVFCCMPAVTGLEDEHVST